MLRQLNMIWNEIAIKMRFDISAMFSSTNTIALGLYAPVSMAVNKHNCPELKHINFIEIIYQEKQVVYV